MCGNVCVGSCMNSISTQCNCDTLCVHNIFMTSHLLVWIHVVIHCIDGSTITIVNIKEVCFIYYIKVFRLWVTEREKQVLIQENNIITLI